MTRAGWCRVVAAGQTQVAARVVRLTLDDGRELVGTGDHPVWVRDAGWRRLDGLRYGDILPSCDPRWWSLLASSFGATRIRRTGPIGCTSRRTRAIGGRASAAFTRRSGARASGLSPRNTTFTTSTAISSTTTRTTSSVSPSQSTRRFTRLRIARQATIELLAPKPARRRRNGIVLRRGAHGIVSTALRSGGESRSGRSFATSAALLTRPGGRGGRGSVPTVARQHRGSRAEWMTSIASVLCAGAPFAATGTPGRAAAGVSVLSVSAEPTPQPVYNLTVEGAPEYLANGILVHNCDCVRYVVAHRDLRSRRQFVSL